LTDALTTAQAARRLELSRERVIQLNREGKLPAVRTALGRLFDVDVVERFAHERQLARAS
jgi:excisionase family DNA binding protein